MALLVFNLYFQDDVLGFYISVAIILVVIFTASILTCLRQIYMVIRCIRGAPSMCSKFVSGLSMYMIYAASIAFLVALPVSAIALFMINSNLEYYFDHETVLFLFFAIPRGVMALSLIVLIVTPTIFTYFEVVLYFVLDFCIWMDSSLLSVFTATPVVDERCLVRMTWAHYIENLTMHPSDTIADLKRSMINLHPGLIDFIFKKMS